MAQASKGLLVFAKLVPSLLFKRPKAKQVEGEISLSNGASRISGLSESLAAISCL
jgi:hypothetical protein